jgi:hypothetical protein
MRASDPLPAQRQAQEAIVALPMRRRTSDARRMVVSMSPEVVDFNFYVNWLLYAVVGRLSAADAIMETDGASVRAVATYLASSRPAVTSTIYRGVLLHDDEVPFSQLDHCDHFLKADQRTFASWSEDKGVAQWFASRDSVMSQEVVKVRPLVRGWVARLACDPGVDMLWHWSWTKDGFGLPGGRLLPLWAYARAHPDLRHVEYQIRWNLETQREVILGPRTVVLERWDPDLDEVRRLDCKYTHPSFVEIRK